MRDETFSNSYKPDLVYPAGETLRETLEAIGMSQVELAKRMGRPESTISNIIRGKTPITPRTALQLEMVLSIPAGFWNNLESIHQEFLARKEEGQRLEAHADGLQKLPVMDMIKQGWIARHEDVKLQLREVLNFFGVASLDQWEECWSATQVSFKKSRAFESSDFALAAWLRKGELLARERSCAEYDREIFIESLKKTRALTRTKQAFDIEVIDSCAQSGVAIVFVQQLSKCAVSGATRWLTPSKALIQLSLRYKTNDHLWFTFFHEAAHILHHQKKGIFLDDAFAKEKVEGYEKEADRFASDWLIPPARYNDFISRHAPRISKNAMREFGRELGIADGIVVGRLQHDGRLQFKHCNDLKVRLRWA